MITELLKADIKDLQEILDLQYLAYQSEAKLLCNPHIPPLMQTIDDVKCDYGKGTVLKLVNENKIIGSVRAFSENGVVYIGKLMVHPDFQKQGFGTKLLTEIEKYFDETRYELFTSTKSMSNLALYSKQGFSVFKEKRLTDELTLVYLAKESKEKGRK